MPLITTDSALETNDFNQSFTYGSPQDPGSAFTFQGWFKLSSSGADKGILFRYGDKFAIGAFDDRWVFYNPADDTNITFTASVSLVRDVWQHVTFAYGGFIANPYLNGSPSGSQTFIPGVGGVGASDIVLGQGPSGEYPFADLTPLDCMMSGFRLWNKKLSAVEVAATWNSAESEVYQIQDDAANLFSAWPMNEGSGTEASDQSVSADQASPDQDLNGSGLTWIAAPDGSPPEGPPEGSDLTVNLTELFNILDQPLSTEVENMDLTVNLTEPINIIDTPLFVDNSEIVVNLTELLNINDSVIPADDIDLEMIFSCMLQVQKYKEFSPSTVIQVQADRELMFSQDLVITPNNLSVVTNATAATNPTTPTLISNGELIYSLHGTVPDAEQIARAICYVKFNCNSLIGDVSADDTFKWNMSIQNGGGTWQASTNIDAGDFGEEIELFGFTGTVTKKGFDYPNDPYIAGGIFGNRKLNKELSFLTYNNPYYLENLMNQNLGRPPLRKYKTHGDAARLITSLTESTLSWLVQDFPLANFSAQGSQTALSALSSLVEGVGGVLRWNGGNHYTAAYPDYSLGLWEVPECCLITGLAKECNLDLNTGYYSPGVYLVPQLSQFDAGTHKNNFNDATVESPNGTSGSKQILEFYRTTTMKVQNESPVEYVDLPYDFEDVYIQIVTSSDFQGRFVTSTPNRWFLLQTGFAGQYINNVDVAGVLKPVVRIDASLFPQENKDLLDSPQKWYLKVGCTVKKTDFGSGMKEDEIDEKSTLGRTVMRYKFVPTCTGTISSAFFGSIPLPGMTCRATPLNGKTIEGIIESVNFSNPGIVTVNVVQWSRLGFQQDLSEYSN